MSKCDYPAEYQEWCRPHYNRWRRYGDPSAGRPVTRSGMTESERFWLKVNRTEGCWLWVGATLPGGYGVFPIRHPDGGRRNIFVHRYAYQQLVQPIPDGLHIDHLCRVRNCVNPSHLEPVSPRENTMRGFTITRENVLKTHCSKGHPYDAENTRLVIRRRDGSTYRECRTCGREKMRRRRAAAKGAQRP